MVRYRRVIRSGAPFRRVRFSRRPAAVRVSRGRRGRGGGRLLFRLIIAVVIGAVSLISFFTLTDINPFTGEEQRVALDRDAEIALGLQAAPQLVQQFGGTLPDPERQRALDLIGERLVAAVVQLHEVETEVYPFEFTLLADDQTVNAFALPGGQIFITQALFERLLTEAQLAGVLAHEIGHVVHRHGAEHLAKQRLTQGLTGAAVIATYDPERPSSAAGAAIAQAIGQLVNMKFSRSDELESDTYGVRVMAEAGYDPRAMIEVMKVLEEASGSGRSVEFFQTHPNPANRVAAIEEAIAEVFPKGVPAGLEG